MIDQLIARYAAPEPELSIIMPDGETWRFRNEQRWAVLEQLREGAHQFAQFCGSGDDATTLRAAYVVAELSLEPRLNHLESVRFANEAGNAFGYLVEALNAASLNAAQRAEEELAEQAKKE
ncbi:MAG: hypothetical protein KF812_02230 [Fimbriimonadaceae bacterium]|nr:hypothetical protein [Fimbriimonadaceae bacterium]